MMEDLEIKYKLEKIEKMMERQEKQKEKPEISDVTPKNSDEAIERYVDNVPEIFVDKYKNYLDTHKEDDELTRRYPDDFNRSVRVLPLEQDGKRYLRMIATDEKKTENFYNFLREGKFEFENEIIEGIDREKTKEAIKERLRRRAEK